MSEKKLSEDEQLWLNMMISWRAVDYALVFFPEHDNRAVVDKWFENCELTLEYERARRGETTVLEKR